MNAAFLICFLPNLLMKIILWVVRAGIWTVELIRSLIPKVQKGIKLGKSGLKAGKTVKNMIDKKKAKAVKSEGFQK